MLVNEKHIIELIKQGDQKAFSQLMTGYQDYVYSLTFKMLKSKEDAEEVSQNVFVKVYKSINSYNFESKFSTWLYTIAYRSSIDFIRVRKKNVSIEGTEGLENKLHNDSKNPMEQKNLKEIIKHCLSKLEPTDASIISLFYLQENAVKEIAEVTGLSTSNVKVKLFRARKILFNELRQYLGDEINVLLTDGR